jgi:fructose-1,6-bisphosphatase/inositol monophosphatase family enzyme
MTNDEVTGAMGAMGAAMRDRRDYVVTRAGKQSFTDKEDGSPLTEADIAVEQAITVAMLRQYPDIPVFGEEAGYDDAALPERFWLIDPIDGTKSFVENVPAFTSMAALIEDGETIASVIYNFTTDDMYTARKGHGAFKNSKRLDITTLPLYGVAYCKARFFETMDRLLQPSGVHCENGSEGGGFGHTLLVDGFSAARINLAGRGYTHDYAPGVLLVHEAGGVILPVKDDKYNFRSRSYIACHPALESVLRPHLAEIRQLEIDLTD